MRCLFVVLRLLFYIYSTRGKQNEKSLLGFKRLYFRRLLVSSIYLPCARLNALLVWFVVRVLWFVFDAGKVRNVISLLEYALKTTPPPYSQNVVGAIYARSVGGYI